MKARKPRERETEMKTSAVAGTIKMNGDGGCNRGKWRQELLMGKTSMTTNVIEATAEMAGSEANDDQKEHN